MKSLALLLACAASSACSTRAEPTPAPLVVAAPDAGKPLSVRKAQIEAVVTELLTGKGVAAKSVACPSDADAHYTNRCSVVTAREEKLEATCNGDNDAPSCKLSAAVVDATKVVSLIHGKLTKVGAKRRRGKAPPRTEVTCPDGPLVVAVGERFYCRATQKKKTIPVDVTVKDLDGRVSLAFKS